MRWEWGEIETGQSGRWWDGSALGQDAGRIVRMSSGDRLDGWVRVRSCWGGDPQSCGHFRGSNWDALIHSRSFVRSFVGSGGGGCDDMHCRYALPIWCDDMHNRYASTIW